MAGGADRECGLVELVRLFVEDLEPSTEAMRRALDARDLEQLSVLAHRLRGAAGSYRFPAITRQAALVEAAVRAGAGSDAVSCELASLEAICAVAHRPPESGACSDVE